MASFPPEHKAEPVLAHPDGLALVRRILGEAATHLTPHGQLMMVGTGRALLEADYPNLPFIWLDTEDSEGEVFWLAADGLAPGQRRSAAAKR